MINQTLLNHPGGMYLYRVHVPKIEERCNGNYSTLKSYLQSVFNKCPDHLFVKGPRSSALKFKVPADIVEIQGHEVSKLAELGLKENESRFKDRHSKVQLYMLENDSSTIAIEVPIWLEHTEMDNYMNLFRTFQPLTGHIDALRIDDDGKIWIWDYKPNAHKEKYAMTQTFFYALMLSKRTNISLDNFRCGYFDDKYAFAFRPGIDFLKENKTLINF